VAAINSTGFTSMGLRRRASWRFPFIRTGVPHRIKYLEMLYDYILGHEGVVMWTGAEILDWYRSQVPA
jgi:hypothetical protein